jgi:hypothetical protein
MSWTFSVLLRIPSVPEFVSFDFKTPLYSLVICHPVPTLRLEGAPCNRCRYHRNRATSSVAETITNEAFPEALPFTLNAPGVDSTNAVAGFLGCQPLDLWRYQEASSQLTYAHNDVEICLDSVHFFWCCRCGELGIVDERSQLGGGGGGIQLQVRERCFLYSPKSLFLSHVTLS